VAATAPQANAPLLSLVEGSQRSYSGSGWPKQEEASHYDAAAKLLKLQHLEADYCTYNKEGVAEGIRAYMPDPMSGVFCHMDVQAANGCGMLLRYVSTYVPKFSDSFTDQWLNDSCSGYEVARRVLTDYHPLEPEMILSLAMQWFPQVFAGGSMRRFVVPVPYKKEEAKEVSLYLACAWKPESMTLLEFLRLTNKDGAVQHKVRKRHAAAVAAGETTEALESWACAQKPKAETLIAASYLSKYNDEYYGQWLVMNRPFKSLDDFWRPELEKVPDHLYYQTMAYLHNPEYWCDEA
jgi:hypothetical protein